MGLPGHETPCALFSAICYNNRADIGHTVDILEDNFGKSIMTMEPFSFDHTDYYEREMGESLKKTIVAFEELIPPGLLPEIKLLTNDIEERLKFNGQRCVNLDPGYLNPARVVLASTKDYSHRLYLSRGIYGEVTLRYDRNAHVPQPWTYSDYREEAVLEFFGETRRWYMERLRELRGVA